MKYGSYTTGHISDGEIQLADGKLLRATKANIEKMVKLGSFMYEIVDEMATNIQVPDASKSMDGAKYDEGKLRLDLIPVLPLLEVAKVFTLGAGKYDDRNWERGISWGKVYGAALRHLFSWWAGERIDPEMRTHHLANAITNLLFLLEFDRTQPGCDDRTHRNIPMMEDESGAIEGQCPICGEDLQHTGNTSYIFKCPKCLELFESKYEQFAGYEVYKEGGGDVFLTSKAKAASPPPVPPPLATVMAEERAQRIKEEDEQLPREIT